MKSHIKTFILERIGAKIDADRATMKSLDEEIRKREETLAMIHAERKELQLVIDTALAASSEILACEVD
jgi:hypothetical protein